MSDNLNTISRKLAAERYAQMFAAAAATEERIKALAESEGARMSAESELSALTYPDNFPRVWGNATEPPPPEVVALIDIISGTPYRRRPHSDDLWDLLDLLIAKNGALSEENRRLKDRLATYEPTEEN